MDSFSPERPCWLVRLSRCWHLSRFFRIALASGILVWVLLGSVFAQPTQWNSALTNTPSLVQIDFGPYGDRLPGDGEEYCVPTSLTMNLYWAASNGFTQLAPASYDPNSYADQAAARNLDLVIAGLIGTTATGGSDGSGVQAGMATYFAAEGISTSQYTASTWNPTVTPVLNWLAGNITANEATNPQALTLQIFSVGWFPNVDGTTTWTRNGGHGLDPLSVDLTGTSVTLNNPYPSAFLHVPNEPGSNPQTVGVTPVPSTITLSPAPSAPSQDYSLIQSPYLEGTDKGSSSSDQAVIEDASAWSIDISALPSSGGYTINPWEIDSQQFINTNGGTFTVIAPLQGIGGFLKAGTGELHLTNTNALSGTTTVEGGSLVSTVKAGTPFGTGSIQLENDAILEVRPDDSSPTNVNLQIASGMGSQFEILYGGGTLQLTQGANTSLTVTLGGNTDGSTPNIVRNDFGSLVISPDGGLSALGGSTKLLVAGSGGNLPTVTNGMVMPSIIGRDTDPYNSGSFLTYSGTNGFIPASPVFSTSVGINDGSITGTTIYEVNTAQSITGGNTVSVYALEVDGATLGESQSGSTIKVGSLGFGDTAGIIMNGGTIAASTVNFGFAEGAIYTSFANGTINSQIEGTGGLTTFGPGELTITSDNSSSLSGQVSINEGTLIAANTSGSATGSGPITINSNATLQVASGASVSGTINVTNNGSLYLNGGMVTGALNVNAPGSDTSETGGELKGHGIVAGPATVAGMIKTGPETGGNIEFQSSANLDGASFYWQLNNLTDTPSEAGIDWNTLQFDLSSSTSLGTPADPFTIYLDFSLVQGPESSSTFWQSDHTWTLFNFASDPDWADFKINIGNSSFPTGFFYGTETGTTYLLSFTVPEPATWLLLAGGMAGLILVRRLSARGKSRLA